MLCVRAATFIAQSKITPQHKFVFSGARRRLLSENFPLRTYHVIDLEYHAVGAGGMPGGIPAEHCN